MTFYDLRLILILSFPSVFGFAVVLGSVGISFIGLTKLEERGRSEVETRVARLIEPSISLGSWFELGIE